VRAERLDDRLQMANTLVLLSRAYRQMGRIAAAAQAATQALAAYRTLGRTKSWQYAEALRQSALIAQVLEDNGGAQRVAKEALRLSEALDDRIQTAACRMTLGEMAFAVGEVTQAISFALQAAEVYGSLRDSASKGQAFANAAAYLIVSGDLERAKTCAIDALIGSRDGGWSVTIAIAIQQLATAMALLGDHSRAALLCGYVDRWFREVGYEREYTEQTTYELLVSALGSKLAEEDIRRLTKAGSELSEAQAIVEALR
jgi:tetratricopeptide (TPR) repeat protein